MRGRIGSISLRISSTVMICPSAMAAMLSRPAHPQLKLKLCEGLLQAGLPPETLAPMVPRVVLDLAVSRSDRRPTFKNVLRER